MKTNLSKYACGIVLLGALATASAQSTWNYFISDAGGGNSLLTWNVAGSLATPPGSVLLRSESTIVVSIDVPGIFTDAYVASGALQSIPTPDGSYFQLDNITGVYIPIVTYEANNVSGGGNDSFGIAAPALGSGRPGHAFLYIPGTQSVLIPIDFSNFNAGTYQSQQSGIFDTPLTVNLTVVPEPSTLALSALSGLCGLVALRRSNKSFGIVSILTHSATHWERSPHSLTSPAKCRTQSPIKGTQVLPAI
jgi:hypothetical protein